MKTGNKSLDLAWQAFQNALEGVGYPRAADMRVRRSNMPDSLREWEVVRTATRADAEDMSREAGGDPDNVGEPPYGFVVTVFPSRWKRTRDAVTALRMGAMLVTVFGVEAAGGNLVPGFQPKPPSS